MTPDQFGNFIQTALAHWSALARERNADVRRSLAQEDRRARVDALLDLMYTPAWFGREVRSHLLGDPDMTKRAQVLHLRVSGRHDAADRLAAISAPTLVLHGDDDHMAPVENAGLIADRIPDSRVLVTHGGRHGFFDEFRDEVCAAVRDFLS